MKDNIPTFKFALRESLKDKLEYLPTKADPESTGWDVRAAIDSPVTLSYGEYFRIPLGFRCIPESGWWYAIHPRSSTFAKKSIHGLIGIIDETYPLECMFAGQFLPTDKSLTLTINPGEGIGQIIPYKRQEMVVENITNDEFDGLCEKRAAIRTGGFGSTDNK